MSTLARPLRVALVFIIIVFWIFSGWPQIPEASAAQFGRPDSDVSIGSWTGSPVNTTGNRYQNIDEATASDSDYVRSDSNPSNSPAEFGLGDVTDPESSSGHIVRVRERMQESGGGAPGNTTVTIELKQGSTVIRSEQYSHGNNDTIYYDRSFTLTSTEAGTISDYTDLRINIIAHKTAGARSPWIEVTWAELEVPDVVIGTLTVDIVDGSGAPVASPSMTMSAVSLSFVYQTATGSFSTSSQKVRVSNTTATPTWTLSLAASAATAVWDSAGTDYDFNDPTAGAGDGGDTDSVGGRMTVDPSVSTITPQSGCSTTDLTKGSQTGYSEGVTDSITLATAGSSAETGCYWDITGVSISQTIPAEQPTASDYDISMTVSVVAS